jgi:hypothetical protein
MSYTPSSTSLSSSFLRDYGTSYRSISLSDLVGIITMTNRVMSRVTNFSAGWPKFPRPKSSRPLSPTLIESTSQLSMEENMAESTGQLRVS